ncbi:SHOCT domain-containing protein [Nocardioides insulae]|uniref:SHOCT domain-containing protein n=1 Tax=Nocardioides insulae TaxID=394734 RepID=UPI00048F32E0|nr:SHOCT domain-containing protein [Nocardioides insulae]
MIGRVGRPGLIGTMARTAVISGTATAVSGGVARRQQNRWANKAAEQEAAQQAEYHAQQQAQYQAQQAQQAQAEMVAMQAQLDQLQAAKQAPAVAAPAGGGDDLMAQLSKLADLKSQGLLNDAEFAAAKAKLLG